MNLEEREEDCLICNINIEGRVLDMKKTLVVDQDQVLADLLAGLLNKYNKLYNDNLKPEDIKSWAISEYTKCGEEIYDLLNDYHLFRNLPVIENSQEVLYRLTDKYSVYIVTSATYVKESMIAKMEWLNEHFPFIPNSNIVFCGDKSIIDADIMIDDGIHNLENFKGDTKILFNAHHNQNYDKFIRVYNWLEIGELLL